MGVVVTRLGDPAPLVSLNAERPFILASTTKLFTSAAALDRLGPDYKFRTRLYRDAQVGVDGVLPGHLVVTGGAIRDSPAAGTRTTRSQSFGPGRRRSRTREFAP